MTKIDDFLALRIKDNSHIEDVVGEFLTIHKRGPRYVALCPFHPDKHLGNFVVYPKKNCFRCFSCEAKGGPVDFVMKYNNTTYPEALRYLGEKLGIDMERPSFTPPPPRPVQQQLPVLFLPWKMVTDREHTENDTLCQWMRSGISWDSAQRYRLEQVLKEYHVGHSTVQGRHEFTIFWQIDENGKVRTGHMMKYGSDGHRIKKDRDPYDTDWIHSLLTRKRNDSDPWPWPQFYDPDKQEHKTTLFGLHLLDRYGSNAVINIVESEKTALLMATAYGNHSGQVWMACCGMSNLTRERLAPILKQNRRIVLYPDRDGIDKWRIQAERLHYDRLTIDTTPVTKWWKECDGQKADIADVVIRCINESNNKPVDIPPAVKQLIERLDLERE